MTLINECYAIRVILTIGTSVSVNIKGGIGFSKKVNKFFTSKKLSFIKNWEYY